LLAALGLLLTTVAPGGTSLLAGDNGGEAVTTATGDWQWELPPGFPEPRVPPGNPMSAAKIRLGRFLFYDTRLSRNGTYSCASCHVQERAFTDGRGRAVGSTDAVHPRGAMSLANVAYNASLTWADPDVTRLEAQARIPMFNEDPVELGLAGLERELTGRLRQDVRYRSLFHQAFPGEEQPVAVENVVRALASFERTLISGSSPYDRLLYLDESNALSRSARRGMRLFFSDRLACSKCHGGFNFSGPVRFEGGRDAKPTFHNTGLYNVGGRGGFPAEDTGLEKITQRRRDMGRFRAPTLRNIGVTAPYMHDGSVASLEEVIDHYAQGGRTLATGPHAGVGSQNRHKSEFIQGFAISADETADLVAFLHSLTDRKFLRAARFSDPFAAEP